MKGQTKALYQIQRQITYQRHRQRLNQINQEKAKAMKKDTTIQQMHRIRNKSSHFKTVEHVNHLNHQNQKIINSILNISKRKSQENYYQPSMVYFNNPARKRHQRQIARTNSILAQRILTKQSQFDPTTLKKNIFDYQQRKRIRQKSKISLPSLQRLSRVHSVDKHKRSRSKLMFSDEENREF